MNKYSLDELAFVDRCLFPGDLINDLEEAGFKGASMYKGFFIELSITNSLSVLRVYQEFISDDELIKALDKVIQNYLKVK